jgi:hypothetical protein
LHVFLILFGTDQFVMTVPHELEQVFQKFAHAGGTDEILEVQFAETPAQVDPEVLVVEHFKLTAVFPEEVVAILVKSRDTKAGDIISKQFFLYPLPHLLCRILGIGDGENFIGMGVAPADQVGNALGEDGGLPRARAGDDHHGAMDMFDSFALTLVGFERPGT